MKTNFKQLLLIIFAVLTACTEIPLPPIGGEGYDPNEVLNFSYCPVCKNDDGDFFKCACGSEAALNNPACEEYCSYQDIPPAPMFMSWRGKICGDAASCLPIPDFFMQLVLPFNEQVEYVKIAYVVGEGIGKEQTLASFLIEDGKIVNGEIVDYDEKSGKAVIKLGLVNEELAKEKVNLTGSIPYFQDKDLLYFDFNLQVE